MSIFLQRFRSSLPSKGFTLTELVVVIAIMTLLTGVFLTQQRQFDSTTLLRSLSYSVALSIREAQTYGTSVRVFEGVEASFPAYGVYFNVTSPTQYILFADVDDNGIYAQDDTELVDSYEFSGNYSISDICGTWQGTLQCASDNLFDSLTITFRRPNPEACIVTDLHDDVCGTTYDSLYSNSYIQIEGPGGATRGVVVTPSGQISVCGVNKVYPEC